MHYNAISLSLVFPNRVTYMGWVCCWFSTLLWAVFLRVLRFSPLLKNQHFQIPIRSWNARTFLNEFLWTPWCSVGKQITFTFFLTITFLHLSPPGLAAIWRSLRPVWSRGKDGLPKTTRSIIMLLTWNRLHLSWSYWLPKILLLLCTCNGIKDAVLHKNGLVASCHCKWQTVWHENINSIDSSALNSFLEIQSLIANFHTIYYKSCLQNLAKNSFCNN